VPARTRGEFVTSKRLRLAAACCVAVMASVCASAALAGEVTGNGKPTAGPEHANSICAFSGKNDHPEAPLTQAAPPGPGGPSQSYGQENRLGLRDPSKQNPGKVGQGELTFHPGFACNGEHGFLAGG
jgi:hypothetical protein